MNIIRNFFCLVSLLSIGFVEARSITEAEKLSSLVQVWGFLKYHHPKAALNNDWDYALLKRVPEVRKLQTSEELNRFYSDWLTTLGKPKPCRSCDKPVKADSLLNIGSIDWLHNGLFSDSLQQALQFIRKNRHIGISKHLRKSWNGVNVFSEEAYPDSVFPGAATRLLTCARFWNVINYYFPYKPLIGEDWNFVLMEMAPEFYHANDTVDYHLLMMELVARINDSHSYPFITKEAADRFGKKSLPFPAVLVEDKLIVRWYYNDSLGRLSGLKRNDIIHSINGRSILFLIDSIGKYVAGSNLVKKRANAAYYIRLTNADSMLLEVQRGDSLFSKMVACYTWNYFRKSSSYSAYIKSNGWRFLKDDVGYMNMGLLRRSQVGSAFRDLRKTKAIIIDCRNYPRGMSWQIAWYLNNKRLPFSKFATSVAPGIFGYNKPWKCGRNRSGNYKGRVVVLMDDITQSAAEHLCMALKTAPDVTFVGSPSSGADGGLMRVPLPGGYRAGFTGFGVYYPDGTQTQRVGIQPDIFVRPTIAGMVNEKDEVLDRALEFIENGKY